MGEVVPRVAMWAVILTHRSPLPLGEVRAPRLPAFVSGKTRLETGVLGGVGRQGHFNLPPLGLPPSGRVARSGCGTPAGFRQRSRPERNNPAERAAGCRP